MKNSIIVFFCLALILTSTQSFAQLSKKEKKEWKKKAKEYSKNPENLKQLTEDKAGRRQHRCNPESKGFPVAILRE